MRFLRTASTRRLLAVIAGVVLAIAAGTAIAIAATGSGPVPSTRPPLAQAIHSALSAPAVTGITAQISFTNRLIDSSEIQDPDPLLSGATGRLWLSSDHRLRLELQGSNGDAQVVIDQRSFWVYDPQSNTVYQGTLPADASRQSSSQDQIPSVAQIQSRLNQLMASVNLSGARPSDVARRPTYTLRVSPKHDGGLLGSVALAWDAVHGVPLRFALFASGQSQPVLALQATSIHFGPVGNSAFAVSPPNGAKVVTISTPAKAATARSARAARPRAEVTGAAAVAKHLSFKLRAPGKLVGLPRRSVSLLDWGGANAALVSYGQNLGGLVVIEQPASAGDQAAASSTRPNGGRGLSLPSVSIDGATGQELDTAIGTVVQFTRGGVHYTVLGSVPAAAADAAARAL